MRTSHSQGGILLALPPEEGLEERIPTLAEALDAFLADLYLSGRSTATRQTYRYLLKPLGAMRKPPRFDLERPSLSEAEAAEGIEQGQWPATSARADQADELYVTDFTTALCRAHLADRINRKQSMSTIVTVHGAMCAFANWLIDQHYISESPLKSIPAPKVKDKPHRYLSVDEMKRLWNAALTSRRRPAENCLILLLLAEGLRANELVSLRWSDIKEDRIVVAFGKGGTVRSIALTEALKLALDARRSTAEVERRLSGGSENRIIPCNVKSLEVRIALLGKRAKVPHVHPHLLRHSFASHFLMEGGIESMEALRQLGGWSAGSKMPLSYARSVLEEAALKRSREIGLSAKLFGE